MKFSLLAFIAGSASAATIKGWDCNNLAACSQPKPEPCAPAPAPVCGVCPQPDYKLCCTKPIAAETGKLTSKTKEEQKDVAEAKNQYEAENDQLQYEGQNNECRSEKQESSSQGCQTEIININGEYNAEQKLTDTQHGKSAETNKGATCYRKEIFKYLNQIGKACDYQAPIQSCCGQARPSCNLQNNVQKTVAADVSQDESDDDNSLPENHLENSQPCSEDYCSWKDFN